MTDDLTTDEKAKFADLLLRWFPWLGTDEEIPSAADQVEHLCSLYGWLGKEAK